MDATCSLPSGVKPGNGASVLVLNLGVFVDEHAAHDVVNQRCYDADHILIRRVERGVGEQRLAARGVTTLGQIVVPGQGVAELVVRDVASGTELTTRTEVLEQ